MNNNKFKISVFSICMYVFAALLVIYFIYLLVDTKQFISDAVAAGQVSLENDMSDIVRHYITTCGTYFIYAVVFVAFGYIGNLACSVIQRGSSADSDSENETLVIDDENDEELENVEVEELNDSEIEAEDIEEEVDAEEIGSDEISVDDAIETVDETVDNAVETVADEATEDAAEEAESVQDVVEDAAEEVADDDLEIIDPSDKE